jgi:hypothetical protein
MRYRFKDGLLVSHGDVSSSAQRACPDCAAATRVAGGSCMGSAASAAGQTRIDGLVHTWGLTEVASSRCGKLRASQA